MRILSLYPELMNLYGDNGNLRSLLFYLDKAEIPYTLEEKTLGDTIDFTSYNFVYCGSGTEKKRDLALSHLLTHRENFRKAVEDGVLMLFTGNSWQMLGQEVEGIFENKAGLGISPFRVKESTKRVTKDLLMSSAYFERPIVGFLNTCAEVVGNEQKLLHGAIDPSFTDGLQIENFYGLSLVSPVLVKNPFVLQYFFQKLSGKEISDEDLYYAYKAYEIAKNGLEERFAKA